MKRLAVLGTTILFVLSGCTGNQAARTGSPGTTTASAAPLTANTSATPNSPTSSAAAIKSIDCQPGPGAFRSLEEAWNSDRRLTSCETTLNLKHKQTKKEQQAIRSFRSYAEDTTAYTALEQLYGMCAAKDAEPDFYRRAHRAVLQGALILCPEAPHASAFKAK